MIRTELCLKGSKKHHAIAPQIHQVLTFCNEFAATCIHFSDEADEPDEADKPDEAEMVAATAARSLPSTRAGGQDDGS